MAFEPISFTNSFLRTPLACLSFLSTSYDSHGLTTSFFGASLARLLTLEPLCYFVGSWTIILAIRALMVFTLLLFLPSPIFHIVGLLLSLGPFAKMDINTYHYRKKAISYTPPCGATCSKYHFSYHDNYIDFYNTCTETLASWDHHKPT